MNIKKILDYLKYTSYNKYRNKEREIYMMLFNKKLIEKIQEDDKPNEYKAILGIFVFILTVLVGFVITVNTDNVGMYSGLKVVGLGLVSQVVFWGINAVIKKLK